MALADPCRRIVLGLLCLASALAPGTLHGQPPDTARTGADSVIPLDELRVEIGRLRIGGVPLVRAPLSAQIVEAPELRREGRVTAADALADLPGVSLSDQFGSPFQPDVRLRGFSVSPVVGLPQSVSVFVDGVRVNEADASQVHFNLIPSDEVERVEVIRGPLGPFGKNTLAGALNLVTRRGEGPLSAEAEVSGGFWNELKTTGRLEGQRGNLDYYVAGRYYRSRGWRDLNHAEQIQTFSKVGWRGGDTDAWISYTFASDSIEAPGSLPRSWLRGALPPEIADPPDDLRELQFTGGRGDFFSPTLHFVKANLDRAFGEAWTLQASGFGRFVEFDQFNDNITEPDALGLTDIGSFGGTVQLGHRRGDELVGTLGVEYSRNDVDIEILQLPNRAFPDIGRETTTLAGTEEDNVGVYSELWWALGPRLSVYGSVRFDHVSLPFEDRLEPENSGENEFDEGTGAVGLDVSLPKGFSAFGSFGRGFRAPVILEVTCADPENPCPLPFELGADPPLDPVTTYTWQGGVRYGRGALVNARLTGFWSEVRDDLFNVVDLETPTRGFFANIDATRRQGVEVDVRAAPVRDLVLDGTFAWTRATFQTAVTLAAPFFEGEEGEEDGPGGPEGDDDGDGALPVRRAEDGDAFPMVPGIQFTVGAEWSPGDWVLGLDGNFVGPRFMVGDESNLEEFGELDGYFLLDAYAERTLGPVTFWVRAHNLLDSEHETFGIIAENVRPATGDELVEPFFTPGRPFRIFGGIRYTLQ